MKIILMMAMTLDGIIAKSKNHNADWTSKADKKAFIVETKKHGVIIMGENTFLAIGRPLSGRLNFVLTLDPKKYAKTAIPGQLEFFKGEPKEIRDQLALRGYESAILGGGSYTNASFLNNNLVDEILITVEPKIFGNGMTFAMGLDLNINLELLKVRLIGDNAVQLRYQVVK